MPFLFLLAILALNGLAAVSAHAAPNAPLEAAKRSCALLLINTHTQQRVQNAVAINAQGQLLTTYHGLAGAQHITAHFANGTSLPLRISYTNPQADIALLTPLNPRYSTRYFLTPSRQLLSARNLPPPTEPVYSLGRTSTQDAISVRQGHWAMAQLHLSHLELGSPTLSQQGFATENGWIHTSAISQGWSGSPVVNVQGQLVAINHAVFGAHSPALTLATPAHIANALRLNTSTQQHSQWVLAGLQQSLLWQGYGAAQIQPWLNKAAPLKALPAWNAVLAAAKNTTPANQVAPLLASH